MYKLLGDFRFMNQSLTKALLDEDKRGLVKGFQIKKVKAGQRIYSDDCDRIDTLHLILRGKTGIFFNENRMSVYIRDKTLSCDAMLRTDAELLKEK